MNSLREIRLREIRVHEVRVHELRSVHVVPEGRETRRRVVGRGVSLPEVQRPIFHGHESRGNADGAGPGREDRRTHHGAGGV